MQVQSRNRLCKCAFNKEIKARTRSINRRRYFNAYSALLDESILIKIHENKT